jgi:hypothetical protein
MRAVIFLAIVGVAFGINICRKAPAVDVAKAKANARVGAITILGNSCPSFNLDAVAFSGACGNLVNQAICYGARAASVYDGVDTVTYKMLANEVKFIESLGNQACREAAACYDQVAAAIQTCLDNNENFVQETIDAAEKAYKDNFEAEVASFAGANQGSLLGDLINMAMDQFTSADDIQEFIDDLLTDKVVEDAKEAAKEAKALAQQWCANGCTSTVARFLEGIFRAMHGGKCNDASVFCGACQRKAARYFQQNDLPCCIENVVQKGIEAYQYVVDNYEDTLSEYAADIGGSLSADALDEAQSIRDRVVSEFSCVREVYSNSQSDCA